MTKERVMESLKDGEDKVQMKKQLGLLEGVAIILGIILGSGRFIRVYKRFLLMIKIKVLMKTFFRNFFKSKRSDTRSAECWFISNYLGLMWFIFNDWCFMLCRIRYEYTPQWWRLCLHS